MADCMWKRETAVKELKRQLWLAVPLFSIGLLQYSMQIISLMFVGHLGELALASASLATSFVSVTGFNVLMGMACALDTLCGQSYGASQHHMLGLHVKTAALILTLVSAFLAAIWVNTEPILIALHQDAAISTEAGVYARFMIPGLFAYGVLQCLLKFLQTQNIVLPLVLSSGITALIHAFVCWILLIKYRLGIIGSASANSISYWLNVLLIASYVKFSHSCSKSRTGHSKMSLRNVVEFLKLAIPSAFMLCLKIWTFELIVLASGLLHDPKLETSVLSICLNTFSIMWMISFGLSEAVSIRVSNELGAANPLAASLAVRVNLVLAVTVGIFLGVVMFSIRDIWGHVYSNEEQVIRYVAAMMPIVVASSFLDGIQSVLSSIAKGCGWQKIGAYVNLGSFYLVGVPCSAVLTFVIHMKGKGLWLGLIPAFFVQVLILAVITKRTKWEKEADKAANRIKLFNETPDVNARDQNQIQL